MKVLIIIPAYNEELNIEATVKDVKNNTNYDYVIVNDGSKDKTKEICQKNNFNLISLPINYGLTSAIQVGMKYAKENNYDIAIQFDGDGQHDINYVEDLIKPILEEDVDMTIGSRFIDSSSSDFKSSGMRRLGIKVISFCIRIRTGKKIYDTTSGFRAVNKKVLDSFAVHYPLEYPEPISSVDILLKDMKIKEVPVSMNERIAGKSSIGSWKNVYYMINVTLSILLRKRGK